MEPAKLEFDVQMTCESCASKVTAALVGRNGIKNFDINLEKGTVTVETTLTSLEVKDLIEASGRKAVIKGYGSKPLGAAVAMLGGDVGSGKVMGVVRFVQLDPATCIIEGTIDGLSEGNHGIHVYEYGDITRGCDGIGEHYNPQGSKHGGLQDTASNRHFGDLGNIKAGPDGRASFRLADKIINVYDIIGRSLAVTANEDDCGRGNNGQSVINGNSGERLACGIIARSAAVAENPKRICLCDGVSVWDERDKPLAGPSRSSKM